MFWKYFYAGMFSRCLIAHLVQSVSSLFHLIRTKSELSAKSPVSDQKLDKAEEIEARFGRKRSEF